MCNTESVNQATIIIYLPVGTYVRSLVLLCRPAILVL